MILIKYCYKAPRNCKANLSVHYNGIHRLSKCTEHSEVIGHGLRNGFKSRVTTYAIPYFQSMIGIMRWMVELGILDKIIEVFLLWSHPALLRKGHLGQQYL